MTIFGAIIAVIKAIPVLDSWFQSIASAYLQAQIASMKQENRDAIISAVQKFNQIPMENAIGSSTAGKVSGDAGSAVIDAPPPGLPKAN